MAHTFLLEAGLWMATGSFTDAAGRSMPVEGQSEIVHRGGVWVVDGVMRLLGPSPVEYKNRYEVVPFASGSTTTTWTAASAAIGTLDGRFVVVADVIFSTYRSDDGSLSGAEVLIQMRDTRYLVRGSLVKDGALLSSWAMELRRIRP
jgi:hypothetical protein